MVNSSAMVAREPPVSGEEETSYSFAEILDSSPPPSSKKQQFANAAHDIGTALPPGLRRKSSRVGIFGKLTNTKIRNSVLRRDHTHNSGRSTRVSFLAETNARQGSVQGSSELRIPARTPRNQSPGGTDGRNTSAGSLHVSTAKERIPSMASEPPTLKSAYSQAAKYGPIMAPIGSVDTIIRTHKSHDHHKKSEAETAATNKRPTTSSGNDLYGTKLFVLTTTGYLLQYAGEGSNDRVPERSMQLTTDSAAMASDAIPGKHWVLHISTPIEDEPVHHRSRFALSKLGLGGPKPRTQHFLLIMDSADELDGWIGTLRREIQSHVGRDVKPDVIDAKSSQDQILEITRQDKTDTEPVKAPTSSIATRPGLMRATTAPEVISSHRITSSMAKQGLLLRMDESDSEDEPEASVSISNNQALPHGPSDATSPTSTLSITDNSSHRSRPSTDTASSPQNAPAGRRPSGSTQSGSLFFHLNDLDSVIEGIIPCASQQPAENTIARKPTGLRKKTSISTAQSMSPSGNQPQSATTQSTRSTLQPLSAGFKRLSPLADIGPIVLTPPDSPENSVLLRPRSLSMLEDFAPTLSPRPVSLKSPISDPGLLSSRCVIEEHIETFSVAPESETAIASNSALTHIPAATDEAKDSMGSDIVTQTASWIPPRHSSLMYQAGIIPTSSGSSGKSPPSSGRKGSITPAKSEKLKVRLASLDTVNLPHANALLLAPSPHPPPTGALPDLPKCKTPTPSRPGSRAEQVRKASVVSATSGRSASPASMRKLSDAERTATPEPTSKHDETLVVQVTPRKPRVEKVILPSMADVPATRPQGTHHPAAGNGPSLTVAERRRRRSPSPVHNRGRSNSQAEKVLSAISEMTEASEAPRGLDEVITIGFAAPVAEESELAPETKSSSNKNLLPNGMPNPLAGNPIRTPDMRMIPRPPSRDAPAVPVIPAVHQETRTEKEKQNVAHQEERPATRPMARRPSILERAVAAIEAAKDGKSKTSKGHARSSSVEQEPRQQSSSDPLAAVAPHFQESLRPLPPRQASLKPSQPVPAPTTQPLPASNKESPQADSIQTDTTADPQNTTSNPESHPPSASPLPPPPTSPSTKPGPPVKHIAQLLAIAELPSEPMTPPMPMPEMKASITAFNQDEFDMWAWPVGAGKEPGERYAPLSLDLQSNNSGDSDGDGESGSAGGGEEGPKSKVGAARWSLFKAIEGIE